MNKERSKWIFLTLLLPCVVIQSSGQEIPKNDEATRIGVHFHTRYCDGSREITDLSAGFQRRGIEGAIPTVHLEPIDNPVKEINLVTIPTNKIGFQDYLKEVQESDSNAFSFFGGLEVASAWPGEPLDKSDSHLLILDISNPELQRLATATKGQADQFQKLLNWCHLHQIPTVAAHPTHRMPTVPEFNPRVLWEKIRNPVIDYKDGQEIFGIKIPTVRIKEKIFSYPYDFSKGTPRLIEFFNNGLDKEIETVELLVKLLEQNKPVGVTAGNDFHTRLAHQEFDPTDPEKNPLYMTIYKEGRISNNWDRVTGVYPERVGAAKPSTKETILKALWDGRSDARCRYAMRVTSCLPIPTIEPLPAYVPGVAFKLTGLGTKYKENCRIYTIGSSRPPAIYPVSGDTAEIIDFEPNGLNRQSGETITKVVYLPERWVMVTRVKKLPLNLNQLAPAPPATVAASSLPSGDVRVQLTYRATNPLPAEAEIMAIDTDRNTLLGWNRIDKNQIKSTPQGQQVELTIRSNLLAQGETTVRYLMFNHR